MPIQIPNLDDRNYSQLLKETSGVITRYFPEYTDIGPSDPAIVLNELFCYLFDVAVYQINRITPNTRRNFASLLGIQDVDSRPPEESLRQALTKLSRIDRAVTIDDITAIVKKVSLDLEICSEPVLRVYVIPGNPVRVFIVQQGAVSSVASRHKIDLRSLYTYLRRCSPIGTRYLIRHAPMLSINVSAELVKRRDSTVSDTKLATEVKNKLSSFFDPFKGGISGNGWEFGRSASRGEIYGLIESVAGVDHVRSILVKKATTSGYTAIDTLQPEEGGLIRLVSPSVTVI